MKKAALLCLLLLACDPGADKPLEPAWNKQPCAHCMMLLSDKRTAAQLTLPSGERAYFDDLGCMVSWLDAEKVEPRSSWVRSPDALSWALSSSAHFAAGASTPMDFGFVPAASGLGWNEVVAQIRARPPRGGLR